MSEAIRIEFPDAAAAQDAFKRLAQKGKVLPFDAIGRKLKTSTQLRFRNETDPEGKRWRPSWRVEHNGGQTLRNTSRLRNSISYQVGDNYVDVGTNVIYAAMMHFGGEIRAKRTKFLSIPLTPKARTAGSPRKFPGTLHYVQSLKGQPLLMDSDGVPQYLLKKVIRIAGRPFLGFSASDRVAVLDILRWHLLAA